MDALEKSDLSTDLEADPSTKLVQVLEMMSSGLRLQRENLRRRHPELSDAAIDELFQKWLFSDDDA